MTRLTRRRLLQGTAAGSALLPFVPLLGAHADDGALPRRIVFLYSSNGTVHESWLPSMSGGQLQLSPILEPLEPYRDRLLVVDGLDYTVCIEKGEKTGHYGGMNTALTGAVPRIVDPADDISLPEGPSIDQMIGEVIGANLRFRSLECGIQVDTYNPSVACTAHSGPSAPIYPENEPAAVFERVFADFMPDGGAVDPQIAQRLADRKSIIDFVNDDLGRLRGRLAAPERDKVDAHLEALRQFEQALETGTGVGATDSCAMPDAPGVDPWSNDEIPAIGRQQIDLLVMALACDLTRVGTIQYGRAGAQHRFSWLGPEYNSDPDNGPNDATSGIHGLAHNEANPDSRAKLAGCHRWYAGEMKYLLDALAAVPEGDGSMLDNTLVVWFNELGKGGSHALTQTPWVLAGNVNGHFSTGRLVSANPGTAHNQLLMSLCHAMGLEPEYVGDADYGREPLAGLT